MTIKSGTKISVTTENIQNGLKGSCNSCPVALAILEKIPDEHITYVEVSPQDVIIYISDGSSYSIDLPEEATDFIDKFDNGISNDDGISGDPPPFSFELGKIEYYK